MTQLTTTTSLTINTLIKMNGITRPTKFHMDQVHLPTRLTIHQFRHHHRTTRKIHTSHKILTTITTTEGIKIIQDTQLRQAQSYRIMITIDPNQHR